LEAGTGVETGGSPLEAPARILVPRIVAEFLPILPDRRSR
jgi:hypothetical protein